VRDESSASNADVTAIPSQFKVTKQILLHWQPFRDLKLMFAGSRRAEQLSLRSQQRVVATVEESVLKTEMAGLESQEEDAPSVSSSSSQWVGWGRSGLTVGMSPGLLVFGRHFSPCLWALRSRRLRRSRS
jgi:hypothetical protein